MTRFICDVCDMDYTDEHAVLPPVGYATINGKQIRLLLDTLRTDLGFPMDVCSGCLMMAVGAAVWNVDPSDVVKEIAV